MDIQKTAKTLIKYLGQNPELIKRFIEHPYSTTATAVGSDARISKKDMSEVLTATAAMSNNQKLGMSDVANIASALLSQNGNSVHSLASMLFGGGNTAHATQVAQQQTTPAGTLNLGTLVNMASLAATLMGGAAAATAQQPQAQPKPTVNLADGLDLGEVAILAGQFLSANNAALASTLPPSPSWRASCSSRRAKQAGTSPLVSGPRCCHGSSGALFRAGWAAPPSELDLLEAVAKGLVDL